MKRIRWTTEASDQFVASIEHIREDNSAAALKLAQTVLDRIEQLRQFPGLGRLAEVKGTRELTIQPYRTRVPRNTQGPPSFRATLSTTGQCDQSMLGMSPV